MPDKLTDSEIVKALELCVSAPFCGEKTDCPYKGIDDCVKKHTLDALDLINRLQAENERLKDDNEYLQDRRWKELSYVKAEAYKEFAERLHEYINGIIERHEMPMFPFSVAFVSGIETKIDNLLKELVGD